MLRDFATHADRALRACLVTVAGVALIALPGCGIKRSLTMPPTPPAAATAPTPPVPAAAATDAETGTQGAKAIP